MKLRAVCRIKIMNNGFAVEYPTPAYQEYFKKVVSKSLATNGVLEVTVADPVESDNQAFMRLFHAIRDQFAKHWAEPKNIVEDKLIQEFGVKEGLKKRLKNDYGATEGGELKSLTKYTRGEWIPFLRGVVIEAAEQGIDVLAQSIEIGTR